MCNDFNDMIVFCFLSKSFSALLFFAGDIIMWNKLYLKQDSLNNWLRILKYIHVNILLCLVKCNKCQLIDRLYNLLHNIQIGSDMLHARRIRASQGKFWLNLAVNFFDHNAWASDATSSEKFNVFHSEFLFFTWICS